MTENGSLRQSGYDTVNFPGNKFLMENGSLQQIENITGKSFDSILIYFNENTIKDIARYIDEFGQLLDTNGNITIIINYGVLSEFTETEWDNFLLQSDWILYHYGALNTECVSNPVHGIVVVRKNYNPITHARHQLELGQPWYAITLLDEIPDKFISKNDDWSLLAMISMEKQSYYLKWQELFTGLIPDHTFFTQERSEFGLVTAICPDWSESYRLHSRFWSRLKRDDMAIRVLQSIEHVSPDPKTRHLLQILEHNRRPLSNLTGTEPPTIEPHEYKKLPRILVICHDYSDYGLDTLFHGLCTILGKENVVEFPWKPTLHGCDPHMTSGYPCLFNYPGEALTVDNLVTQLKSGCFDLILYADVIKMEHQNDVRRLVAAAPDLPLVLYDTWDNCYTPLDLVLNYIDRKEFSLIFKRELLQGVVYEGDPVPLPFGYPESFSQALELFSTDKKTAVFWAGKKEYGLRPLYLRRLENIIGMPLDVRYDQESYKQKLRNSLIGLSFFGYGFDTVRYWELPANGVMLLAERPPIQIPHNFVDGESAVFFDNVAEMEEKLEYYINHPEAARQIAIKGHEHYLKYHTATARAHTFIGVVCAAEAVKLRR